MEDEEYLKLINDYPEIKIFLEEITKTVLVPLVSAIGPIFETIAVMFEPINIFFETIEDTIKKNVQKVILEYIKNKKGQKN